MKMADTPINRNNILRTFTPLTVENHQRILRGIKENLDRSNAHRLLTQSTPNLANGFNGDMTTNFTATNGQITPPKKNQRYKGDTMHQIKNSLQQYTYDSQGQTAVNGEGNNTPNQWRSVDVASSHYVDNNVRLSRLIELGYDKDLAIETLKANPNKSIEVVMEMLNCMTSISGRKSVTKLQPGTLSYSRSPSQNPNGSAFSKPNRPQGIQRSSAHTTQTSSATQKLFNVLPSHNSTQSNNRFPVNSTTHNPWKVTATETQKTQEVPKPKQAFTVNHNGVVLRPRKTDRLPTSSVNRWSADYVGAFTALDVNEKRKSMDAARKPPPPYPGGNSEAPIDQPWFTQTTNLKPVDSQDSLVKLQSQEPLRTNSPVTILYDRVQQRVNVVNGQTVNSVSSTNLTSPFTTPRQNRDPPPYEMINRGGINKSPYSMAPSTVSMTFDQQYSACNLSTYNVKPNEMIHTSPQTVFSPVDTAVIGQPICSVGESSVVHGLPPPYSFADVTTSKESNRLSSNLDDSDSGTWSSKRTSMATDGSTTQSDSSASTSPTPDSIERSCSPLPVASSPYHTLIIHNNNTLTDKLNSYVQEAECDGNYRLKNCPSHAFKFYMEQHVENINKFRQQRDRRKCQLETEMAKVGLSDEAQMEMKKMLHQKESNYIRLKRAKMERSFFKKIKTLGIGAFGEVSLVRKEGTANGLYAMKTLRKSEVLRRNQVAHVKAERDILAEADNEWVVKLYYSFQDDENLYFVMDYVPGGDMMGLLIKFGIFEENLARFYIAELVVAIESVHRMGFIHRDIKPDNILIDSNGHIKLTDFGLCTGFRWTHDSKYYQTDNLHARQPSMEPEGGWESLQRQTGSECDTLRKQIDLCKPLQRRAARHHARSQANSLVGTPNYIAPEVLMRVPYTQLCDWWSVGVILFEMLIGHPPFMAPSPADTQLKVIKWKDNLNIPRNKGISKSSIDLMHRLLSSQEDRIGAGGANEIKLHPFFNEIDWNVGLKQVRPPYVPQIRHATDTSNFDPVPERNASGSGDRTEDETRILKEGPQHAFYEFTFRRFFDDGGHPYTLHENVESNANFSKWTKPAPHANHVGNKRMAGSVNKSNIVPNKLSAPPVYGMILSDDKPPVYV